MSISPEEIRLLAAAALTPDSLYVAPNIPTLQEDPSAEAPPSVLIVFSENSVDYPVHITHDSAVVLAYSMIAALPPSTRLEVSRSLVLNEDVEQAMTRIIGPGEYVILSDPIQRVPASDEVREYEHVVEDGEDQ